MKSSTLTRDNSVRKAEHCVFLQDSFVWDQNASYEYKFMWNFVVPPTSEMGEIILNYQNYVIRLSDIDLLKNHTSWINDVIIGFYFDYLNEKYKNSTTRMLFVGPEFTQLLKMQNSTINELLEPLEATSYDYVFFVLNNCETYVSGGSHWSLLIYSHNEKGFFHCDSLRYTNQSSAEMLVKKLRNYFFPSQHSIYVEINSPQQQNGYDCGLYVLCITDVTIEHILEKSTVLGCFYTKVPNLVSKKRDELLSLIYSLSVNQSMICL